MEYHKPTNPSARNKRTRDVVDIENVYANPALWSDMKGEKWLCNCLIDSCDAPLTFVYSVRGKTRPYFKSSERGCAEFEKKKYPTAHKKIIDYLAKVLGAIKTDEAGNWPHKGIRPDLLHGRIVIEIEKFSSGRDMFKIADRNKHYRELGYIPLWICYGREWQTLEMKYKEKEIQGKNGEFLRTKIVPPFVYRMKSFEQGILADCGVLHYFMDVKGKAFITPLRLKGEIDKLKISVSYPSKDILRTPIPHDDMTDSLTDIKPRITDRFELWREDGVVQLCPQGGYKQKIVIYEGIAHDYIG